MRKKLLFFILNFLLLFLSCKNTPRNVTMAFYHWKTTVDTTVIKNIKKEKMYVRLFDVDWDEATNAPKPLAVMRTFKNLEGFKTVTPVVFLTNKVFAQILDYQVDTLALHISEKIAKITEGGVCDEIQFDCDWTATTKERYFSFLKKMKTLFAPKKLSATIRLHQIKFMEKTGVPPVERGMLMAYNMGNLDDMKTDNSILNIETLKAYLKNFDKYPLELDVALPIFSWGIVFRDGEAVKIINNFSENDLPQKPQIEPCFQSYGNNRFVLLKNQYIKGLYLYENDEIRLEDTPLSTLSVAATFLAQNIKNQQLTVAFYHLDSATLQQYRYEDLENITQQFK